jgi:putative flippase GtrA
MLQGIQTKLQNPDIRKAEGKRFAKFAVVGFLGTITHFATLNLLVQIGGVNPVIANACGFSAALVQNFFLNRYWTYPETRSQKNAGKQLMQFGLVSIIGFFINMAVYTLTLWLVTPLADSIFSNPDTAHFMAYNTAYVVAVGVTLFWNFLANRLWTYRGVSGMTDNG